MKNWRNFGLYATGRLVSLIGTGIQDLAVPLFILDLTGSGTTMGTFMIITMAPRLILYPLAGVVGDRINRKWIMVSMDFGRGAVILLLAHLAARNIVTIPVLFAAQFVISLMNALFGPATLAMLPDLVEEEDLTRANSTIQGITSVSSIVGPALGGVIYGFGGIQITFVFVGLIFPQVLSYIGYVSWTLFSLLFGTFIAIGIFNAFANTPLMVEIQKLTPAQFMARVFSVMETTTMGVVPIGFGIMGILLDIVPAHLIAFVVVVAGLIVALLFVGKYSQVVFKDFEGNNS